MALNPKQLRFVEAYLLDRNATKAAKAAGYSVKTAYSQGHDLLKHPEVKKAIAKADKFEKSRLAQKAEKRLITKDRWLRELEAIGFANIDDFVRVEETTHAQGEDGDEYQVTSVKVIATDKRKRSGRAIKRIIPSKDGVGIELHDKRAALESYGRAMGWVKDDVQLNMPQVDSVQVTLTLPSNGREAPPKGQDE